MIVLIYLKTLFLIIISSTSYGLSFLAGISCVIVPILAFTTIIFAQFYDKSAEHSNELLWEIQQALLLDEKNPSAIISKFKRMIFVSATSTIFGITFNLFRWTSYFLAFIWAVSAYGYLHSGLINPITNATLGDGFVIIFSTTILVIVLIMMTQIFSKMCKRVPFPQVKNGCAFFNVYNTLTDISNNTFFLREIWCLELTISDGLNFIYLNQNIPLNRYSVMWVLQGEDDTIYLKLNIEQLPQAEGVPLNFRVKQRLGNIIESPSLIPLLQNLNSEDSKLYIRSNDGDSALVCGVKHFMDKGKLKIVVKKVEISSIEGEIKNIFKYRNHILKIYQGSESHKFDLTINKHNDTKDKIMKKPS